MKQDPNIVNLGMTKGSIVLSYSKTCDQRWSIRLVTSALIHLRILTFDSGRQLLRFQEITSALLSPGGKQSIFNLKQIRWRLVSKETVVLRRWGSKNECLVSVDKTKHQHSQRRLEFGTQAQFSEKKTLPDDKKVSVQVMLDRTSLQLKFVPLPITWSTKSSSRDNNS